MQLFCKNFSEMLIIHDSWGDRVKPSIEVGIVDDMKEYSDHVINMNPRKWLLAVTYSCTKSQAEGQSNYREETTSLPNSPKFSDVGFAFNCTQDNAYPNADMTNGCCVNSFCRSLPQRDKLRRKVNSHRLRLFVKFRVFVGPPDLPCAIEALAGCGDKNIRWARHRVEYGNQRLCRFDTRCNDFVAILRCPSTAHIQNVLAGQINNSITRWKLTGLHLIPCYSTVTGEPGNYCDLVAARAAFLGQRRSDETTATADYDMHLRNSGRRNVTVSSLPASEHLISAMGNDSLCVP